MRASVTDKVEALLSYDYKTFDEDLEAAQEGMTSDFREEYDPTVEEIRDRALAQERSQQAEVVAVGVVDAGGRRGRDAGLRQHALVPRGHAAAAAHAESRECHDGGARRHLADRRVVGAAVVTVD